MQTDQPRIIPDIVRYLQPRLPPKTDKKPWFNQRLSTAPIPAAPVKEKVKSKYVLLVSLCLHF
jgi:hypothetical protein